MAQALAAPARAVPAREALATTASKSKREAAAERKAAARAAERKAAAQRSPRPGPPAASSPKVARAATSPAGSAQEEARKRSAGDPLLDMGGDDALEKELSGVKPGKRSVYVPPALGSDLPASVSVSQINEAVVGQKAALVRCIDQQRAADPDARGTLKLRWTIGGDGAPRDVRVLSDELARQPIAPCIAEVVKALRFPRSRTTGQEVVFPFKF